MRRPLDCDEEAEFEKVEFEDFAVKAHEGGLGGLQRDGG